MDSDKWQSDKEKKVITSFDYGQIFYSYWYFMQTGEIDLSTVSVKFGSFL